MQSPRQNLPESQASNRLKLPIPSDILLSAVTAPLLIGLVAGKAITEFLTQAGAESEEIFRGDRLPVLNFPHSDQS